MDRAVWIILNEDFSLTLDAEILEEKIVDKKFSPGSDIWTNELPRLGFESEKLLIDAKIGEESEYINAKKALLIRKIEEYNVDEIIT